MEAAARAKAPALPRWDAHTLRKVPPAANPAATRARLHEHVHEREPRGSPDHAPSAAKVSAPRAPSTSSSARSGARHSKRGSGSGRPPVAVLLQLAAGRRSRPAWSTTCRSATAPHPSAARHHPHRLCRSTRAH
eukprot:scaffold2520_cov324-Prasinococcus_capsulatus_cf.AAC.1